MSEEACPLPSEPMPDEHAAIQRMLAAKRIAVVGLSNDPTKASYNVSAYLQQHGYEIVPINPKVPEVLGVPALPSLAALDRPADVALVFRRSEHCEQVTREAIEAHVKGVWLQSGIRNKQARDLAKQAGIEFVEDRCMMVTHMRQSH
ncbi:MAG TPA: CoA-binding protein [Tepidisphaeraceae bacterium]|nr:CoA-binding protein [Tepidisphaeraceae bacterium]